MADLRSNWRIVLLVAMLAVSAVVLFAPGATVAGGTNDGPTNLQYGLELDGGSRISAPVVGMSATQLSIPNNAGDRVDTGIVVGNVSQRLDVPRRDVAVRNCAREDVTCRNDNGFVVEVFNDSVSQSQLVDALRAQGITALNGGDVTEANVRDDPSPETYEQMAAAVESKLDASGLSGGSATRASGSGGQQYVVVEAPNRGLDELEDLIDERGLVELRVRYPGNNSTMQEETLVATEGIDTVDPATSRDGSWRVPVRLTLDGGDRFQSTLNRVGFTADQNYATCPPNASSTSTRNEDGYCLLTVVNGDVKGAFSMHSRLAATIREGQFDDDPSFFFTASNEADAKNIQTNLKAGAFPASLDVDNSQKFFLQGSLAERFKTNALITAIVAVLAVSFTVYVRYGNVTVAAPMVVTALSEVVLLLGFAAVVGLPLDLSHLAGFIEVIGTGVDDLIIIADEVMAEEVSSRRVFQSRFRKAFWVIGAAAATTIIAMSPLAILSLGDLRGFAIITILGVLIGVLVTRPAYGDILKSFVTGDK
jgi:preprotein translocase subunit SecD